MLDSGEAMVEELGMTEVRMQEFFGDATLGHKRAFVL